MKMSLSLLKISALILMAAGMFGCKKLLTEYNPSAATAENFYSSAGNFKSLVSASYSFSKFWYGKEDGLGVSEGGTDLWTAGSESFIATSGVASDNRTLILYQSLNPANLNLTRLWRKLYAGVNLCNYGIKLSGELSPAPDPKEVAELYFLRGFYNWHIVETWGNVHFTTEATETPITTANRTSEEVFYNRIFEDLELAVTNLPDAPSSIYGKVNKQAAMAFLARAYLTRGYQNNAYFERAQALADQVIASGKYSLEPVYANIWSMTNQKNKEVIWSLNYSDPTVVSDVYDVNKNPLGYGEDILSANGNPTNNRGNNNLHTSFIPGYDRSSVATGNSIIVRRDVRYGWSFIRLKPTRFLMEVFDETKDSRYNGSFQTMWKLNTSVEAARTDNKLKGKRGVSNPFETDATKWTLLPFAQRDTALVITKNPRISPNYYSYNVLDSYRPDGSSFGTNVYQNWMFPSLLKFQDSTRSASPNDLGTGSAQGVKDVFVIRLAEMYLIAAEALVGMGRPAEAKSYLDVIRTRAAIVKGDYLVNEADINLDFILDERAREFAGENIRWFDLKRTGKLVERVVKYNPDAGKFIQPFHVLRPIPQQQLDAVTNKGEFIQNPGY